MYTVLEKLKSSFREAEGEKEKQGCTNGLKNPPKFMVPPPSRFLKLSMTPKHATPNYKATIIQPK